MSRWWADAAVVAPADVAAAARASESVLASFASELAAIRLRPQTRVVAVVGGDAVRLRIVPWSDALVSPRERHVLAMQSFVEAFGEGARRWHVCERATRYGEATLAAAVEPALLEGLQVLCAEHGVRLTGVQPAFTRAFDAHRRRLGSGLGWFVWIEHHLTTALLHTARAPLHVKRYPAPHADLETLLAREWFALGRDEPGCPVFVDRAPGAQALPAPAAVGTASRFRVVYLPQPAAARRATVAQGA